MTTFLLIYGGTALISAFVLGRVNSKLEGTKEDVTDGVKVALIALCLVWPLLMAFAIGGTGGPSGNPR